MQKVYRALHTQPPQSVCNNTQSKDPVYVHRLLVPVRINNIVRALILGGGGG